MQENFSLAKRRAFLMEMEVSVMDEAVRVALERLRDEDNRQNHRIAALEESVKAIQELTISIHGLACDMKQMLEELKDQGGRLDKLDGRLGALEQEPAKKWRKIGDKLLDTAVGVVGGALIMGLIFLLVQYLK